MATTAPQVDAFVDKVLRNARLVEDSNSSRVQSDVVVQGREDFLKLHRAFFGIFPKPVGLSNDLPCIHSAAGQTLQSLADGPIREADLNDRASSETDWGIELRTRDRQRKLVSKIDSALRRIAEGEYGYCEVTGDPIGLKRLIARPVATMTVESQEAHERREKISRDD